MNQVEINSTFAKRISLFGELFTLSPSFVKNVTTKDFEISTPIGIVKGKDQEDQISFSLSVFEKPYDTIQGIYQVLFPYESANKILFCRVKKRENVLFSFDLMRNSVISIHKSYLYSSHPYEDFSLYRQEDQIICLYKRRLNRMQTHNQKMIFNQKTFLEEFKNNPEILEFYTDIHQQLSFDDIDLLDNIIIHCLKNTDQEDMIPYLENPKRSIQKQKTISFF